MHPLNLIYAMQAAAGAAAVAADLFAAAVSRTRGLPSTPATGRSQRRIRKSRRRAWAAGDRLAFA